MSIKVLISPPSFTNPCVDIAGNSQVRVAVTSAAGALTSALPGGYYDVWSDVDVYCKVATTSANDVTVSNGYLLRLGNTVPFGIRDGYQFGAIAASAAGTVILHKTWNADI